ncbi:hypothetical protein B296_00026920 [Ensete ventricosum]|uniref:Uncharacterized protein n=1 Tax=Ensete ventricosum TaxID=4639 RepID=A0A426YJ23_ENSVE|nr:hypothetical protein B296_00026920 [Ensete ventricosum]
MGEIECPSSLIYPAEEFCISSKTLRRNLIEDNSCQIFTIGDQLKVDCPLHFPTKCQSKAKVMQTYLEATTSLKKNRGANFMKDPKNFKVCEAMLV